MKLIRADEIEYVPASHEDPKNPGVLKKVLLAKEDIINGRIQMINWASLPAGKSFNTHYHTDMEEIFIMTKGESVMVVGDERVAISKGDTVVVPINQRHKMLNKTDQEVEYIVIGVTKGNNGKTIVTE